MIDFNKTLELASQNTQKKIQSNEILPTASKNSNILQTANKKVQNMQNRVLKTAQYSAKQQALQKQKRKEEEEEAWNNLKTLENSCQEKDKWLLANLDQNNTVLGTVTDEYREKYEEKRQAEEAYMNAFSNYYNEYREEYDQRLKEYNQKTTEQFLGTVKKGALTVADAGINLLQSGITDIAESIADAGTYAIAQAYDAMGYDEDAQRLRQNAQVNIMRDRVFGEVNDYLSENSYLGDTGRAVTQGIGQTATLGLLAPLPGVSTGVLWTSSLGNNLNEAYATEGISDAKAWAKAGSAATLEVAVEKLFTLLGYGGSSLDDMVMNSTEKINNGLAKAIVQTGATATGEGIEEMLTYAGNYLIDHGLDLIDENGQLSKEWDNEELWENFFVGALSSGISQGAVNSYKYVKNRNNSNKVNSVAQNETLPTANQEATVAEVLPTASEHKTNNTESTMLPTAKDNVLPTANNQNVETTTGEMLPTAKQNTTLNANSTQTELSDMLNNKDLPMQKYQYEISSNEKINEMSKSASGYFNNSEQSRAYLSTLAKIVADKNIEIKFDGNLKTSDGRIARGSYSDGVITINPYSPGTGEFIAIHELTHAIGTKNMVKIIENFKNSNIEFNTEVKDLLNNYSQEEISEEALSDICGQLFGTQEFINNVADAHPTLFQKIYSEIKYLWHQFRGYKNQNQFIEDLYFKWNQAYNSSNKLNNTTNYYIENVANYDEIEYNNSKEIKLPKREYAILSGIVNSDSNIKSGINEVETTNAQYTVYFKETGEFKVLDKIINEREDINVLRRTLSRDETTRSKRFDKQMDSKKISNQRTRTYDDGILEVDSPRTYKRSGSNYNGETNSRNNVKYSIQESENNSGSFSSLVQDNKGRTLSQEQQEYFKDSKVRDENGNLLTMYHGTEANVGIPKEFWFSVFDIDKAGKNGNMLGDGFYFTTDETHAKKYAHTKGNTYETYLNIKKPLKLDYLNGGDLAYNIRKVNPYIEADIYKRNGEIDGYKVRKYLLDNGYDGIQVGNVWVAFNSEQIKNVDNTAPTNNPDIRYSTNSNSWQKYLEKNFTTKGTRTNMQDILVKKADSENSYTMNEAKKSSETESKNIANNKLETGKWTAEKKKGDKQRKHYDSIIKSQYTSKEAKNIARELMGVDTYVPESNAGQLKVADKRLETAGADNELNSLLSRAVNGGAVKADDIAVGERLIQYYSKIGDKAKLQDAIQATAMAGTTAGQTVQAMSLLNHQTPEGQAIWLQRSVDKMNSNLKKARGDNAEQFNLTQDMIEKIVNSENSQALENNLNDVYEELGQQVTKTTAQKIDAWRYFSMLSSPRTHVRNITGNTTMAGVQGVKNKVAGVIEGAVSKVNPEMERTHTVKLAPKEVKAFAKADIENVADRLGLSENKYNPKTRLENNMRTFKSDAMEKTVGKAFELNNNLLEAEDGWGLKAGYVKALSEYMTANNLTPETITDKQLGKARNYAVQQAKEATFHQDSQLASLLNQLSNKNKFAKFAMDAILPYKKTPINVAKTGIEYSPVGLIKSAVLDTANLRKGNITVNQYIDNISKGLTGTGIALVGYALANCGVLKASGSDDEDRESFEESRGSQNYSITIGDNTYSLDWLAPSGIPLFIGAECYELMQASKEKKTSSSDEDELYNQVVESATNILDSFANAMNPMTEMSMLSGLTSSLKSYDQGSSQMLASIGANAVKSYVNQFVPTLLGQIAKTTDQYERSTTSTKTGVLPKAIDSTKNQIMSKIPGLRQQLPIKTDTWGNDVKQSENVLLRTLENSVLPWTRKELNSTAVDKELLDVYESTGENSVFPDSINKNITINKQKYSLTSEEYAKYKKQYGQTSYNLLNSLIKSSDYKKMSDSEKQFAIDKVYSYATEQIKVDYAKQNNLEYEQSTLSQVTNAIKEAKGDTSYYFEYLAQIQELDKDSEKVKVLASSKADNNTKQAIYENSLGKEDKKYQVVKDAFTSNGLDITQYLEYKSQEFTSDTTDDGTVDGKTVSGSKKKKVYNYIESMKATYTQKLILSALEYKPTSYSDKKLIINYVNSLNKTAKEKLEILEQFKGVTIYKDGTYSY